MENEVAPHPRLRWHLATTRVWWSLEMSSDLASPWLTVREAAARARCGPKLLYREVSARRLRAAVVGGRRALRFRVEWIDNWLEAQAPHEVRRDNN